MMKPICGGLLLLLAPCSALAREYRFDLGAIEAPACYRTQWNRQNSLGAPVPQNQYSRRVTKLVAVVVATPASERESQGLQACGARAQKDLLQSRSLSNLSLFSNLFDEYMRSCVRPLGRSLQLHRAFVDYEDQCQ